MFNLSIVLAIITAIIWGVVPVMEKIGIKDISPFVGLFYRCLGVSLGLLILGLFLGFTGKPVVLDIKRTIILIFSGLLASVIGQIIFYFSLNKGEVSQIVPIVGSYPLVSFILGIIILKEPFTLTKIFGVSFIIMGVWLLSK